MQLILSYILTSSHHNGSSPIPQLIPPSSFHQTYIMPRDNPQQQQHRPFLREQDQYMPIANVIRIMRRILPPHAKISDDAKETIQECVSEYISFVTGEANERCQREQRKTVTADDVLWAMGKLGFDNYVEPLSLYLARYRETEGDRAAYRDPSLLLKRTTPHGHHHQDFGTMMMQQPAVPLPSMSYNMQQQQQQQQGPNNFQMHNNNIEHQGMYDASSSGGYYRDPSFGSGSGQGSGSGGEDGWGSHFDIYPQFK